MMSLKTVPLADRLANALVTVPLYLFKTVWPANLSVLYPLPDARPVWAWVSGLVFLAAISVIAVRRAASRPWLPVGWFWFLGMLVPVIGIVQVGIQAMADRYTYLPLIGVFIMAAWAIPESWVPRGQPDASGQPAQATLKVVPTLMALTRRVPSLISLKLSPLNPPKSRRREASNHPRT
jgi:hypothetical protein